jgi:hypothetical protein
MRTHTLFELPPSPRKMNKINSLARRCPPDATRMKAVANLGLSVRVFIRDDLSRQRTRYGHSFRRFSTIKNKALNRAAKNDSALDAACIAE